MAVIYHVIKKQQHKKLLNLLINYIQLEYKIYQYNIFRYLLSISC